MRRGRFVAVTPFTPTGGGTRHLAIRRYLASGAPDITLAGDGKLIIDLGVAHPTNSPQVTLLKDSSFVVAFRQAGKPLLQCYTSAGKLDTTFATNVGSNYKVYNVGPSYARNERLYTDSQGRVVFMQYVGRVPRNGSSFIWESYETIGFRASRYLNNGLADSTFGRRGGIEVSFVVDSPPSYRVAGRVFNRRFAMNFSEPQIESNDNVIVAGAREYARGSSGYPGSSSVTLPFIYAFGGPQGSVHSRYVAGIDPAKSQFNSAGELVYVGVQSSALSVVLTSDNVIYMANDDPGDPFRDGGLAVFKPSGNTFVTSGYDGTFASATLRAYGRTAWAIYSYRAAAADHAL